MSEIRTIDVLDLQGKKAGSVDLPAEVFDVETNIPLMHQVVVAQLAAGFPVVARRRSARRAPVTLVRARSVHLTSPAVASSTVRSLAITRSAPPRR